MEIHRSEEMFENVPSIKMNNIKLIVFLQIYFYNIYMRIFFTFINFH